MALGILRPAKTESHRPPSLRIKTPDFEMISTPAGGPAGRCRQFPTLRRMYPGSRRMYPGSRRMCPGSLREPPFGEPGVSES